jgi:hypothetical protein
MLTRVHLLGEVEVVSVAAALEGIGGDEMVMVAVRAVSPGVMVMVMVVGEGVVEEEEASVALDAIADPRYVERA